VKNINILRAVRLASFLARKNIHSYEAKEQNFILMQKNSNIFSGNNVSYNSQILLKVKSSENN
jgi:hypothetical protein